MSSQTQNGYDVKFVTAPPASLNCLICLTTAREPKQHGTCGKLFCNSCITRYQQQNKTLCPHCRQELAGTLFIDNKSMQEVRSLKVQCNNKDFGCQWSNELRYLKDHLTNCDYITIPCPKHCTKEDGTPTVLLGRDLETHLAAQCSKREIKCARCKENGPYDEMITNHPKVCPQVKMFCPNQPCTERFARCNTADHLSVCKYQTESCKYQEFGCTVVQTRKNLQKHEEDIGSHFLLLACQVLAMRNEISLLRKELNRLKVSEKYVFKATDFCKHKEEEGGVSSKPFFSHNNGYKMAIRVFPSGYHEGKGTHVSVCVYLMKGPFDDLLSWPFDGLVQIELLNQLEDKHHMLKSTSPPKAVCGRVTDQDRSIIGWPQFIPFDQLRHFPELNRQYFKDDCLFFRISVILSHHKDWLQCS